MYRVVFLPEDAAVEDAYSLASEWGLSIQHGDSPRTELLDFDRSKIQILSIPIDKGFEYEKATLRTNEPISIKYSNDHENVKDYSFFMRPDGIKVGKTWSVPSMLMDDHRAVMNIAVSFPGKYQLVSVRDGIEQDTVTLIVLGPDDDAEGVDE
jgi:hypothetical protein